MTHLDITIKIKNICTDNEIDFLFSSFDNKELTMASNMDKNTILNIIEKLVTIYNIDLKTIMQIYTFSIVNKDKGSTQPVDLNELENNIENINDILGELNIEQ